MKYFITIIFSFLCLIAKTQMSDKLLYYYDFAVGDSMSDKWGSNDLTNTGATIVIASNPPFGAHAYFDNTDNDYLDFTSGPTEGLSELTISLWYRKTESVTTNPIWVESNSSNYWQFLINQEYWYTRDASSGVDGAGEVLNMPALSTNTWYNLIFVYSVSGGYKRIYVNNVLQAEATTSINQLNSASNYKSLGYERYNSSYHYGYLDEIAVFNQALSNEERAKLYNGGVTPQLSDWINSGAPMPSGSYTHFIGSNEYRNYIENNLLAHYQYDNIPEVPENPEFNILYVQDYDDLSLQDPYSEGDGGVFPSIGFEWSHGGMASIAQQTINGATSNVLKVKHPANTIGSGYEAGYTIGDRNEVWFSYQMKFADNWPNTHGGKIPGLGGEPRSGDGYLSMGLFQFSGAINSYNYVHNYYNGYGTPLTYAGYAFDTVFINPGNWYNITVHQKMNTFTGGVANDDGYLAYYVDGHLVIEDTDLVLFETQSASYKIDYVRLATFFGGADVDSYAPPVTTYSYFDSLTVYTRDAPADKYNIVTPARITNKNFVYDYLLTLAGTLENSEYGGTSSGAIDETFLIDAGAGNTITYAYSYDIGSNNTLLIYDGNTTDSDLMLYKTNSSGSGSVTSAGRYLFVRYSTYKEGGDSGFTGTLTFN